MSNRQYKGRLMDHETLELLRRETRRVMWADRLFSVGVVMLCGMLLWIFCESWLREVWTAMLLWLEGVRLTGLRGGGGVLPLAVLAVETPPSEGVWPVVFLVVMLLLPLVPMVVGAWRGGEADEQTMRQGDREMGGQSDHETMGQGGCESEVRRFLAARGVKVVTVLDLETLRDLALSDQGVSAVDKFVRWRWKRVLFMSSLLELVAMASRLDVSQSHGRPVSSSGLEGRAAV